MRNLFVGGRWVTTTVWERFGVATWVSALGNIAAERGDYQSAKALYPESVALFRELDHERGVSNGLGNLGNLALHEADYARAAAFAAETVPIKREIRELEGVALGLGTLGLATFLSGAPAGSPAAV